MLNIAAVINVCTRVVEFVCIKSALYPTAAFAKVNFLETHPNEKLAS